MATLCLRNDSNLRIMAVFRSAVDLGRFPGWNTTVMWTFMKSLDSHPTVISDLDRAPTFASNGRSDLSLGRNSALTSYERMDAHDGKIVAGYSSLYPRQWPRKTVGCIAVPLSDQSYSGSRFAVFWYLKWSLLLPIAL